MTSLPSSKSAGKLVIYRHGDYDWHFGLPREVGPETEIVEVMPVSEHESLIKPVQRSIANQRTENQHLIRQLEEARSSIPEDVTRLRRQVDHANSLLARSSNRGQVAETELNALRATVHGHVQVLRGMCTDELDHREIDRALVRLDDAVNPPADDNEEENDG